MNTMTMTERRWNYCSNADMMTLDTAVGSSKVLDAPWRVRAIHFYLLAIDNYMMKCDAAMVTAIRLAEYEDFGYSHNL